MATNLAEKGSLEKPLILANRTAQRAKDLNGKLTQGKSVVASNIQEAIQKSDIIFTSLGKDNDIQDLVSNALKSDVKGKLFVECSTVHPKTTDELAKTITEHGAEFVACPGQDPS